LMGIGRELPVNQIKPSKLGSVTRGSPALVIETAVLASLHAAIPLGQFRATWRSSVGLG